jgi:tetratricopeptide (TPR) repeat protein
LQKAAGRLDTSLQRFAEALPLLTAAAARDTTDGEISYYLAISLESLGRENDAVDAYQAAMRSPQYRASSALRLAEGRARRGEFAEARELISESLESSPGDLRAFEELVAILSANGASREASKQASDLLRRFPLSAFLREELGEPDLEHLSADPYRVLNVATQYARLGLYRRAIEVLSRKYPATPADQHEPGIGLPQDNPLVAYFRGYCRHKLGESSSEDYLLASRLSTLYVFPSSAPDKLALEDALASNPQDATAHSLLGTWYFARGKTAEALDEWNAARRLNPDLPALGANIGLALLHEEHNSAGALKAFEEGIANDRTNIANYSGALVAMTLLGMPAADRVKSLERYPDLSRMPTSLVYQLALARAQAGNFDAAKALFQDRFFGREEGGTNVRQVWIEVRLLEVAGLAKTGDCSAALTEARSLSLPVAGLEFTRDGLEPILDSARAKYLLGDAYAVCGRKEEASASFAEASYATEASDVLWAWAAARRQAGYDRANWIGRLNAAITQADVNRSRSSNPGWWLYTMGALHIAAGGKEQGLAELRKALLLPESRMSYHFCQLALRGATPE